MLVIRHQDASKLALLLAAGALTLALDLKVLGFAVVVVGFELKMGNRAGTMSLCIPYNAIEPIMGVLAAQNWFSYQRKGGQEDHARRLTRNVSNAPVEMRCFLARTTMKVDDLLSLAPGDLITTEKPTSGDAFIEIEGRNKFLAQIGQVRGNRAARITRVTREIAEQPADKANASAASAPAPPTTAAGGQKR